MMTLIRWGLGLVVPAPFVAAVAAAVAWLAIAAGLGAVYIKGRGDGSAACELAHATVARKVAETQAKDIDEWSTAASEMLARRAATEAQNDNVESGIDAATAALPDCGPVLGADWLRELERLR